MTNYAKITKIWPKKKVNFSRLHCKDFHCKNYRYSLCPFSHCSFNAFLAVIQCIQSITVILIRCKQNLQLSQCDTCIFLFLKSTFCILPESFFRGIYLNILHSKNCTFCNPIPAFFASILLQLLQIEECNLCKI